MKSLILLLIVPIALGLSSQRTLFKCLQTFKKGYKLDCNGLDRSCCTYFKRKQQNLRGSRRRAKFLETNDQEPDYDFSKLRHSSKKDLEDLLHQNEIDDHYSPPKKAAKFPSEESRKPFFDGGFRRGIVLDDNQNKTRKDEHFEFADHELTGTRGYDKQLCATLRVPCRFVNDHPCCRFEMPLDLVARARALDGSADLKWRPKSLGGPRLGPQGRSLGFSFTTTTAKPVINKYIKYNFATNKKKVSIPKYHYDGGPEMTSTILGLCWRLHYVKCPNVNSQNSRMKEQRFLSQKIHPCCHLLSKPSGFSPLESRLSKWLRHQMV